MNEEHFVRTVNTDRGTVSILDSGADVSHIPSVPTMGAALAPLQVQDAQGAPTKVKAESMIDFL